MTHHVTDLPRSCWRLMTNPLYVALIISVCLSFSISGYTTFLPKYLQFHFGLSASMASVYTGSYLILTALAGKVMQSVVSVCPSVCFYSVFEPCYF